MFSRVVVDFTVIDIYIYKVQYRPFIIEQNVAFCPLLLQLVISIKVYLLIKISNKKTLLFFTVWLISLLWFEVAAIVEVAVGLSQRNKMK